MNPSSLPNHKTIENNQEYDSLDNIFIHKSPRQEFEQKATQLAFEALSSRVEGIMTTVLKAVSYTHLTLPTICSV